MITILNRKEVCMTYDMNRQAEIRYLLQGSGIDYRIKVVNRTNPSSVLLAEGARAYTGARGESSMDYEYHIFVHKDDYEEALHLIQKNS